VRPGRPAVAPVAVGLVLGLVAGCAPGTGVEDADAGTSAAVGAVDVDVDTPPLRRLREEAGLEPCRPGDAEPVDGGLPELELPCLGGGEPVDLARLGGPLVVNFWAQSCAPCRTEMPILQEFHEDRRGEVGVVGIDWQDVQPEAALELARDTGVTYPLLADPGDETSGAGPLGRVRGLPMLVLVDADGRVVHQEFVALESRTQLDALVEEHLGVAS
jgi:thiol-disulfide isomerase/thioredoxin